MSTPSKLDRTTASAGAAEGEADLLVEAAYDQLRAVAGRYLQRERAGHTLQPTALVHEAYMKLADQDRARWQDRTHFLAVAATTMRRILVNHAKRRQTSKRGGGRRRIELDTSVLGSGDPSLDLIAIDEALQRLATMDSRQSEIVEMRFFGGMTEEEIAKSLNLSARTVRREWVIARAWLRGEVTRGDERGS